MISQLKYKNVRESASSVFVMTMMTMVLVMITIMMMTTIMMVMTTTILETKTTASHHGSFSDLLGTSSPTLLRTNSCTFAVSQTVARK